MSRRQPIATQGTNYLPVDFFTGVHLAVGAAAGAAGLSFPLVTVGALAWELFEQPLKDSSPKLFPSSTQDTAPNALVDVAAVMAGWWLAQQLRKRR